MLPKTSYKKELFLYFFIVFVVFTAIITSFQYKREKQYKAQELESILNSYTDFVSSFMQHNRIYETGNYSKLDSIIKILPRDDIRITVIHTNGVVLYDSYHLNYYLMENHKDRPEVREALQSGKGTHIRVSESINQNFYYYAKLFDGYFVRAAVVYSLSVKEFLRVENFFIFFIVFLFLITSSVLLYVSNKIGKSINKLKDFAVKAGKNENIDVPVSFPENELGTIGQEIVNIYKNLRKTNKALANEKEKLIYHLQLSTEGVAIFSKDHQKIVANNRFNQYLSIISDNPLTQTVHYFDVKEFEPIKDFITENIDNASSAWPKKLQIKSCDIIKNNRNFEIQCIIFRDNSYEVTINEVTKILKQKKLKQEMTSNIAHELRTPVSSIKAYLETIITQEDIPHDKIRHFAQKASLQTERLADLIRDISILTKIEEAKDLFDLEVVNLITTINDVLENLNMAIVATNATVTHNIEKDTMLRGNRSLLYSIFHNLLENALKYGGPNVTIKINAFMQEGDTIYFSFANDGVGIEEKHHQRVFERFYRVEEGRARKNGGTGLGLAIVKNAVQFHGGEISVRNYAGGGTEFIFSLTSKT